MEQELFEALKGIAAGKHFSHWRPISKSLPRNHNPADFEKALRDLYVRAVGDSSTTSPIVPQELAPDVIPLYVSNFPLFDLLEKEPANGLSHTYQCETAFTQNAEVGTLVSETGSVNDDSNTYDRQTSNIAVYGTRRGVTLKAQAAGDQAGGPGLDLMGRELRGGLLAMSRDAQVVSCRYQESISASNTTTDANGKFSKLAVNGLRFVLENLSPSENTIEVDITSPWTDQRVLKAVRQGVNQVWDAGGKVNLLVCTSTASEAMFEDQMDLVRYVDNTRLEIAPGRSVRVINTDQGQIPVLVVPGYSLGTWLDGSSNVFTDIIGIDTETVTMPYLGNPMPSILRIPTGSDGTLRELAIPFAMYGLACMAPDYLFRVSLKTANG